MKLVRRVALALAAVAISTGAVSMVAGPAQADTSWGTGRVILR